MLKQLPKVGDIQTEVRMTQSRDPGKGLQVKVTECSKIDASDSRHPGCVTSGKSLSLSVLWFIHLYVIVPVKVK